MTIIRCSLGCLVMVGCTNPTSQIAARFQLNESEGTLFADAFFEDGGLDDGDRVTMTFRGQTARLVDHDGFYFGSLDLAAPLEADEIVKIFVDRDNAGDTTSMIALPPPLRVEPVPLFDSRSEDLVIRWAPATDDAMSWSAMDPYDQCMTGGDMIPPNAASLTIPVAMPGIEGLPSFDTCTVQLTLERLRIRPGASAFRDSTIMFTQQQVIEFASTP